MELTKEILTEIIDKFAHDNKIFSNETQFQFELALALQNYKNKDKKRLINKSNKDRIDLEVLSVNFNNNSTEKMYTDIVVKSDNEYYAIELKYKTALPSKRKFVKYYNPKNDSKPYYYTFAQGAADCGSYDFLKDIERLEKLVLKRKNNDSMPFKSDIEKSVKKGFAIILTNESLYWDPKGRNLDNSAYKGFFLLNDPDAPNYPKIKNDYIKNENTNRGERAEGIILDSDRYQVDWQNYTLKNYTYEKESKNQSKKYDFKYMIVEVSRE